MLAPEPVAEEPTRAQRQVVKAASVAGVGRGTVVAQTEVLEGLAVEVVPHLRMPSAALLVVEALAVGGPASATQAVRQVVAAVLA